MGKAQKRLQRNISGFHITELRYQDAISRHLGGKICADLFIRNYRGGKGRNGKSSEKTGREEFSFVVGSKLLLVERYLLRDRWLDDDD